MKKVESLKTYELRNLLLMLLDTVVGTMTDFEFEQHEAAKKTIRAELERRKV